jgi:hypothetical protein
VSGRGLGHHESDRDLRVNVNELPLCVYVHLKQLAVMKQGVSNLYKYLALHAREHSGGSNEGQSTPNMSQNTQES